MSKSPFIATPDMIQLAVLINANVLDVSASNRITQWQLANCQDKDGKPVIVRVIMFCEQRATVDLPKEELKARMDQLMPVHGQDNGFTYVTTNSQGRRLRVTVTPEEMTYTPDNPPGNYFGNDILDTENHRCIIR